MGNLKWDIRRRMGLWLATYVALSSTPSSGNNLGKQHNCMLICHFTPADNKDKTCERKCNSYITNTFYGLMCYCAHRPNFPHASIISQLGYLDQNLWTINIYCPGIWQLSNICKNTCCSVSTFLRPRLLHFTALGWTFGLPGSLVVVGVWNHI